MTATSIFKHDSAGFLVGDLIDINHELLDAQNAGMAVRRVLRSDVKAIARAGSAGAHVRERGQTAVTRHSGRRASDQRQVCQCGQWPFA